MVIDSSVAVLWFVTQKQSAAAAEMLRVTPDLVAPRFLVLEVAAALLRFVRRGVMKKETYYTVIDQELSNYVEYWDDLEPLVSDAARLSILHGGALYDNCYVALARQLNVSLVTADRQQADTGRKTGISVEWID